MKAYHVIMVFFMLFDRVAQLLIGQSGKDGVLIENLRFSFQIEKTLSETLNNSTISVYNLNKEDRKTIEQPNNALILKAGYIDHVGTQEIFIGIVRRTLTRRDSVDWITDIELDDGLIAYRDSKLSVAFKPGSKAVDVLNFIAKSFGLPVHKFTNFPDKYYPHGWSFVGRSRDAMTKVCEFLGCEWSIQNQEIQILKKGKATQNEAVLMSAESGMIGSPELETKTLSDQDAAKQGVTTNSKGAVVRATKTDEGTKPRLQVSGYRVKSLLQPTVQPGQIVKLVAEGIDAFLKVETVSHSGDTHGDDWFTELSLRFI